MKIEAPRHALFLFIFGILLSCAPSPGKVPLDLARAKSKPGLDMSNSRLGILPLRSYPADIGTTISVFIGNELKDTGIEITETAEMIRMLKEQNITPQTITKASDYRMVGRVCKVDYLLVGKTVVTILWKGSLRTSPDLVDFQETTAEIIDTITGEVVLRASVPRPPKKKWHRADIIGQALAAAIEKRLAKYKQP